MSLSDNIIQKRTGIRAPLERYCPLISGAKAPRSCPAGPIAEVGLRWCGATPRNRTEDSQCQSLQRSDRRRRRQPPFQRQNHRDTGWLHTICHAKVLNGLGGDLHIAVRFADSVVELSKLGEPEDAEPSTRQRRRALSSYLPSPRQLSDVGGTP